MKIAKKGPTKASQKTQGKKADPKAEGFMNKQLNLGESVAQALATASEAVSKGSQSGFLGVEKQTIDVTQFAHSLIEDKKPN